MTIDPQTTRPNGPADVAPGQRLGSWDSAVIASQPLPHFMQGEAWAEVKGRRWQPRRAHLRLGTAPAASEDASHPSDDPATPTAARTPADSTTDLPVQVFGQRLPLLGAVLHAPRVSGVTRSNAAEATRALRELGEGVKGATVLKLELFQNYDEALLAELERLGWQRARGTQYEWAVEVDMSGTLDELNASFKSRARNESRQAEKRGVTAERVPLTEANQRIMLDLIGQTHDRSGAHFHSDDYLRRSWAAFDARGEGRLYLAHHEGEPVAGAFVVAYGRRAWYKDGGSVNEKARLMAPRHLHMRIMHELHAEGFVSYEFGNIPAPDSAEESSMRGLYTFKTAYSREKKRFMPALELPLGPRYGLWRSQEQNVLRFSNRIRREYFW